MALSYETMLAQLTDTAATDWVSVPGLDSGVGVDYYFQNRNNGSEAYINNDQGHISITVDGEVEFFGDAQDWRNRG